MHDAARAVRSDIIVLCHGGPIAEPEDAEYVLAHTTGIAGFFGASSIERLATESGIEAQARRFRDMRAARRSRRPSRDRREDPLQKGREAMTTTVGSASIRRRPSSAPRWRRPPSPSVPASAASRRHRRTPPRRPPADRRRRGGAPAAPAVPRPRSRPSPVRQAAAADRRAARPPRHPVHARVDARGGARRVDAEALRRPGDLRQPQDDHARAGTGAGRLRRGRQGARSRSTAPRSCSPRRRASSRWSAASS